MWLLTLDSGCADPEDLEKPSNKGPRGKVGSREFQGKAADLGPPRGQSICPKGRPAWGKPGLRASRRSSLAALARLLFNPASSLSPPLPFSLKRKLVGVSAKCILETITRVVSPPAPWQQGRGWVGRAEPQARGGVGAEPAPGPLRTPPSPGGTG